MLQEQALRDKPHHYQGDATPGIPFIKEAVPSQEEIVYGESESEFVSDEQPRPRTQELNGVSFTLL